MSVTGRSWKVAAVIALLCTGFVAAAVVGVSIYRYRYVGTSEDGRVRVVREDGQQSWTFSKQAVESPEHAEQTAEEMDLLIQQGIKELVSVREIEVDGQLDSRLLGYEYTLSDGRTISQFEDDPETGPGTLVGERMDEARRLRKEVLDGSMSVFGDGGRFLMTAKGEVIPNYERVVDGRVFSFRKVPFTLSDGTQVAWSIGLLSKDQSAATTSDSDQAEAEQAQKDLQEIAILRQQGKRQLIGVDKLVANGVLHRRVFEYQYPLSDGRTTVMGESAGGNYILSKAQRQEWIQLRDAGSGEDIGTCEEEVNDRLFVFKRQKFVLSDGTELTWSVGTPKNDP